MAVCEDADNERMRFDSAAYWLLVAALALVVAAVVLFVSSDRDDLPGYRAAVIAYVLLWASIACIPALWLLEGLDVGPLNRPLGPALSTSLTVAVGAIAAGAHLIAGLVASRRVILHPWILKQKWQRRSRPATLTETALTVAEAYDEKWQLADRERNRRLGTGPRL